jgi:hypothetical protein
MSTLTKLCFPAIETNTVALFLSALDMCCFPALAGLIAGVPDEQRQTSPHLNNTHHTAGHRAPTSTATKWNLMASRSPTASCATGWPTPRRPAG